MTISTETLFRPIRLGTLELPNRIVMAPMTRSQCPGGVPTEEVAAYYGRRATHGVGLIITEGVLIEDPAAGGYPNCPLMYGEAALHGWRRVIDIVHAAGGKIVPQLWHVGEIHRLGDQPNPQLPGLGPSEVCENERVLVRAMSVADIARIINAFAAAARNAKEIGFDGIEIHGAHGYLVDQFFWERTNRRNDLYGGNFVNRLRFAVDVVTSVREAVGPGFPIIFRFSQWKPQDFNARLAISSESLAELLLPLRNAGVDIFHASNRRYFEPEFLGSNLNLAGWSKKITGCPTITVGSIGLDDISWSRAKAADITPLLERLSQNEFDLVAVGRALLADYAWADKIRRGRTEELIPFSKELLQKLD